MLWWWRAFFVFIISILLLERVLGKYHPNALVRQVILLRFSAIGAALTRLRALTIELWR